MNGKYPSNIHRICRGNLLNDGGRNVASTGTTFRCELRQLGCDQGSATIGVCIPELPAKKTGRPPF